MRVAVIGSGYVGLVTGVCFAELGHEVALFDNDPQKQALLHQGRCPIHEKFVPELLARHRGNKLQLSGSLAEAVAQAEAIFVAVGTPPTVNGEADLSYVESVAREIATNIKDYKIVVGKSTVPVYTSEWVRRVMLLNGAANRDSRRFECPAEFRVDRPNAARDRRSFRSSLCCRSFRSPQTVHPRHG